MQVLESLPDRPLTEAEVDSLEEQSGEDIDFTKLVINSPEIDGLMVRNHESGTYYVLDYSKLDEWTVWESGDVDEYQDAAKRYSGWRADRAAEA